MSGIATTAARDRHCPKCQSLARAQWIEDRQSELLDGPYFHVVFTVPEEIAAIAYQNKEVVYGILFQATAETLRTIAADPEHLGAEIGFFAVLAHLGTEPSSITRICIASCPAAGSRLTANAGSPAGRGSSCPSPGLSRLFRRLFLESLQKAFDAGKLQFFGALEPLRDRRAFGRQLAQAKDFQVGGLCQAPLRRTAASPRLCGPLYPPGRHLQ